MSSNPKGCKIIECWVQNDQTFPTGYQYNLWLKFETCCYKLLCVNHKPSIITKLNVKSYYWNHSVKTEIITFP